MGERASDGRHRGGGTLVALLRCRSRRRDAKERGEVRGLLLGSDGVAVLGQQVGILSSGNYSTPTLPSPSLCQSVVSVDNSTSGVTTRRSQSEMRAGYVVSS